MLAKAVMCSCNLEKRIGRSVNGRNVLFSHISHTHVNYLCLADETILIMPSRSSSLSSGDSLRSSGEKIDSCPPKRDSTSS